MNRHWSLSCAAVLLVVSAGCRPEVESEETQTSEQAEARPDEEASPADDNGESGSTPEDEVLLPGDEVVGLLAELATLQCGCVDFAASFPDFETCVDTLSMPAPFRRCIREVGNDTESAGADYAACYAGALREQVTCTASAACDMPAVDACEMTASDQNIQCQVIAAGLQEVFEACLIREGADF